MKIENGVYHDSITLNSHEVDPFNAAHPTYYFLVMQEVAGAHAYSYGVSIPQLQQHNKTWVVTRTRMTISDYARWPGSIRVETWPQEPWKLYFPRVCRAWDQAGKPLFESLSQWVVMDVQTQRPVKPQQIADLFGPLARKQAVDPDLGRRVSFDKESFADILTYAPRILYTDNDLNMHVNNVVYLQWMLESLPHAFRDTHLAKEIDISYLAQTFRDDSVVVLTGLQRKDILQAHEMELTHEVRRLLPDGESQAVCVAKTVWIERPHQ